MDSACDNRGEQGKAIDAVWTAEHLPDDMMYVPSRVGGDLLATDQATIFLPTPKLQERPAELVCPSTRYHALRKTLPKSGS
jgi:hypothetical protein